MGGPAAFALTLVLTPLVLLALRRNGVLDHPNERSSHDEPIVRGGGIAISLACLGALMLVLEDVRATSIGPGVVVAAVLFGAIGLVEDLRGVPALPRFSSQLIASAIACIWLLDGLRGPVLWRVVFGTGALIWLVAYVNGFNFMDGINGISSAQSFVCGVTWVWLGSTRDVSPLAWGGAILAGAALGFLPYNFPRALLFIGDVGSYFIGGWQAALLVVGFRSGLPPEAVIAPLVIYLSDTATTIARRVLAGHVWHQPHREHAYQRLIRQGWSHVHTTGLVFAFTTACSLLGALTLRGGPLRAVADVAIALLVVGYLMVPRMVAPRLEVGG